MAKRIYNKEMLKKEWENAKKLFDNDPSLGQLPHFTSGRLIKEGTIGDCPKCKSTTVKRFIWFGPRIGCIQPECEYYYKKS